MPDSSVGELMAGRESLKKSNRHSSIIKAVKQSDLINVNDVSDSPLAPWYRFLHFTDSLLQRSHGMQVNSQPRPFKNQKGRPTEKAKPVTRR